MKMGISKELITIQRPLITNIRGVSNKRYYPYTAVDFEEINKQAQKFANLIETRFDTLKLILQTYESHEVIRDEVDRSLDLLRNLKENKKFFKLRIGTVAAFLPKNQPLYAFTCFVVVPSLMASDVHFRIHHSMGHFFQDMLNLLNVSKLFPNIIISTQSRTEFLTDRSAILVNPLTNESRPVTDAVIFTGTSIHADQLRKVFDKRTLFISNGSGHNPVVVGQKSNLVKAVDAVVTLQFYNQGQDCAAPNAILVHKDVYKKFIFLLRQTISTLKIGDYSEEINRIGPISDPKDLVRIQNFLVEQREWIDPTTPGIINAKKGIVDPVIICKPLRSGGNFNEIFAPVVVVQKYLNDQDLRLYFEDPHYSNNAMYITLFGTSKYVQGLIDKSVKSKILHKKSSLIHNTHLHAQGVERGVCAYGGYGYGASSISINGKTTPMPTLPQRDIYEQIIKPIFKKKKKVNYVVDYKKFTELHIKDVQKLLRFQSSILMEKHDEYDANNMSYIDTHLIKNNNLRYVKIKEKNIYKMLKKPNKNFLTSLSNDDIYCLKKLKVLLKEKNNMSIDDFSEQLYKISKKSKLSQTDQTKQQHHFFQNIYQMLFGTKSGPRLVEFLYEVDKEKINKLLDV